MSSDKRSDSMIMNPTPDTENAVPLEDALIIDDADTRRKAIMDVLLDDTSKYLPVLEQAQKNDDVEVVHYATTAMMELSKEYELNVQDYAARYKHNPDDIELLENYCAYMKKYLTSGMVTGQMLEIHGSTYKNLLKELVSICPTKDNYAEYVRCLIESHDMGKCDKVLSEMESKFNDEDETWLLRFRYYYETGSGKYLQDMIRRRRLKGSYNSKEIREVLDMWA